MVSTINERGLREGKGTPACHEVVREGFSEKGIFVLKDEEVLARD